MTIQWRVEIFHEDKRTDGQRNGQTRRGKGRRIDMTKLMVAFLNSVNAPKKFSFQLPVKALFFYYENETR